MDINCKNEFRKFFNKNKYDTNSLREQALSQHQSYFELTANGYQRINMKFIESIALMDANISSKFTLSSHAYQRQRLHQDWDELLNRMLDNTQIGENGERINNPQDRERIIQFFREARENNVEEDPDEIDDEEREANEDNNEMDG